VIENMPQLNRNYRFVPRPYFAGAKIGDQALQMYQRLPDVPRHSLGIHKSCNPFDAQQYK